MDEDDWTVIPDDDVVWSGPTRLPPPLADPAPPLLNTHEMEGESFECRSIGGGSACAGHDTADNRHFTQ
jgi:hypothetical protein